MFVMYIWLLIYIISSFLPGFKLTSIKHMFSENIKKYDLVSCNVLVSRTKRSSYDGYENMNAIDVEVQLKSNETDFHLLLFEDESFQKLKVESYSSGKKTRRENITVKVYEGVVRGESLSSATGYIYNATFVGSIKYNDTIYFVEPADRYFSNMPVPNKVIVYREKDIDFSSDINNNGDVSYIASLTRVFRNVVNSKKYEFFPKGINKTDNKNEEYACEIEMVSDHTLYNYFGGNVDSLTAYLYLHSKYADFVFRRADFDGDGKRDRIRIIASKIFIYKSENDADYPMAKATDMKSFLRMFSLRIQEFCISICMSFRETAYGIIGEAFKAGSRPGQPPGGICQKPVPIVSFFHRNNRSLNTAAVTVYRSKGPSILPLIVSLLAVAHELGHSFGSDHDPLEDLYCSPGGSKGFYLMHPRSQTEVKELSSFFSPCSKKSIASVISERGECLKPYPSKCGNGVQEGDEQCDCGKEAFCQFLDVCCTPSDAKSPEKGCTFRKSKGSVCSSKENKCCLNNCAVNKDREHLCFDDGMDCQTSYCDGKSPVCPTPKPAPDRYPCRSSSKTCSEGVCNSTVCLDNDFENCVCEESSLECHICCKKSGKCVTAASLNIQSSTITQYFAQEGTPCSSNRYQCNGSGKCVDPHNRDLNGSGKVKSLWWTVGGLGFAIIFLLSVLCYFIVLHVKKS